MKKQSETSAPSACQKGSSDTRRRSWWRYRRVGWAGIEGTLFSSPALTAVGLPKAFGPQIVLDDIDLELHAGWLDLPTNIGHVHNHPDTGEHPGPSRDSLEVPACTSFADITMGRADLCDGRQGAA
jgi:hypothetical protein